MPGKKKEGTAGGISGGGSFLWTRRGAWCLVSGEEDRRSWRGSLVSGKRRCLFLERREDQKERRLEESLLFLTLVRLLGKKSTPGKRYRY